MNLMFRELYASEIDCRVQQIKEKGLILLLYKDARCDMNILDETVGAMNWKREHTRNNANCIVSIWDKEKQQWISKEDTGTESNTEAEKGLASDSFKRACVNWGIGRELYTAPFIWIDSNKCKIEKKLKNNKEYLVCNDIFVVSEIEIKERKIEKLLIRNETKNEIVFSFPKIKNEDKPAKPQEQPVIYRCAVCDKPITKKYYDQSKEKYNIPLCSPECLTVHLKEEKKYKKQLDKKYNEQL